MHSSGQLTMARDRRGLGGLAFSLCLWLLVARAIAQTPTPVRVADATCAKCHAEIYSKYLATPMANASGTAEERPHTAATVQSLAGVSYTFASDGKQEAATLVRKSRSGENVTVPLEYFLGSGHLGTTYLYSSDGFLFESPIAWYAASGGFDMKPGLEGLRTTVPALPMQSGCLRCHMSEVRRSDPGTLNHYSGPAFLHTGVTCEACHGDTSAHVASNGKAAVLNPARLDAPKRDSICINCHLEGDSLVERAGRSALDYVPGKSITDFVSYYVYGGKDATARAVSEVEQFAQSGCKRASGERMSCTSCHDPHLTPSPRERVAFYRGKCLACHSDAKFAETHHAENRDCTSCHMKQTGAENIPHVAWTDHRILRLPAALRTELPEAEKGRTQGTTELTAIFPKSGSKRDLAMAYYKAVIGGDKALQPVAWAQLHSVRDELAADSEALDALGVLSAGRGEGEVAAGYFRAVLAQNGNDLTALSNLGILLARNGKLDEARSLLNKAFARNPDISGLALNVARVDCLAGDAAAAKKAIKAALLYNPGLESLESFDTQLNTPASHCNATTVR